MPIEAHTLYDDQQLYVGLRFSNQLWDPGGIIGHAKNSVSTQKVIPKEL